MAEPTPPTARRTRRAEKHTALVEHGYGCAVCRVSFLSPGGPAVEFDHRIPLELGGADDASNLQPLCPICHKIKTKRDQADIAKARRRRNKAAGIVNRAVRKIVSRGFDKTKTRRIRDGRVVERKRRTTP